MLDKNIVEQLKSVFEKLESTTTLFYDESSHAKQQELLDMLNEVASTSSKVVVQSSKLKSQVPRFKILKNNKPTGVRFSGIPGGHEFSSLVLAILNSDGKGKLPDQMLLNRIKNLKGPIDVKTFISLSCENCPEVVQALNVMAFFKEDFNHEMVDGEFAIEESQSLNIQGVPAITDGKKIISSGKSSFIDILEKLEEEFGVENTSQEQQDLGEFDVVVVGAGPAGVSSAIYTARKGLKTVIVTDRMGGQLQDTKGIENLISVPYTEGPELSSKLNKHLAEYDIDLLEHRRVTKIDWSTQRKVYLNSNEVLKTKTLVVTTGAKWRELNVKGEKKYLGQGVAFCPHCDGPFYKGKDISVIGGGNSGVEAAIDLANIVKTVTLVEFSPELKADKVLVEKLKTLPNVTIIENAKTVEVVGDDQKVTGLKYEDRQSGELKQIDLDGVFVQIGLVPNSRFVKDLVEVNDYGEILITDKCRTNQEGIYAAGDVTNTPYKQIVVAMGEGAKAGLSVFEDLFLKT